MAMWACKQFVGGMDMDKKVHVKVPGAPKCIATIVVCCQLSIDLICFIFDLV